MTSDFTGGYLRGDAARGLLLRQAESRHRVIKEFSECFVDGRDQRSVEHSVEELLAQCSNGIVLGYEDLTGEQRAKGADRAKALAGRSTLNRLELGPGEAMSAIVRSKSC